MQPNKRAPAWGLYAVLLIGAYAAAYPLLWAREEAVMYALTDRGCFRRTWEEPALRSDWLARGPLRGPLTTLYAPVNSVLYSSPGWK